MSKQIMREFGKIYRALNSFSDFLMKSFELEKGQYQFLLRVKENPGINQKALSANLLVDKTTTAKAVKKLIAKDYIVKHVDAIDRRNFNLFLTEKGQNICEFLDKEEKFSARITLDNLDDDQKEVLLDQLKIISSNVIELFYDLKDDKMDYFIQEIEKE